MCALSSGEGGLCSLSSPHSIRGLSVARSVALQMSKGGGMLAVCHVVDGLQASSGGAHGFSRGEGGLEGLSLLRLFKGLRELRSVARRRSRRQCAHGQRAACRVVDGFQASCARWRSRRKGVRALAGGVPPRPAWWMVPSSGGMALAAAREASAASSRHA